VGIFLNVIIILSLFAFMEFFAWFMHKYVMHGFLWVLHEDHHRPHSGWFEKNDLFTLFFASMAILLIFFGVRNGESSLVFMGTGVTLYGMGYFLFHDVMFHRRIKGLKIKSSHPYLKRIIKAHTTHHRTTDRHHGIAFGFLFAGRKYDA
jgi:beta-carotene 3-hydroxylase